MSYEYNTCHPNEKNTYLSHLPNLNSDFESESNESNESCDKIQNITMTRKILSIHL